MTTAQTSDRVERFKAEISEMGVADPAVARDRLLLRAGVALLVVGPAVTIVAWFLSHGTTNALEQRDALVVAVIGLSLAVAGAALFVRYSVAQFLRFWLARLSYEQQAQTDRVVAALQGRAERDEPARSVT
jgi:hypothetical protein